MSYSRSSYKASSYRYSSSNDGSSSASSRFRTTSTDDDVPLTSSYTSRRTSNYGEGSLAKSLHGEDYGGASSSTRRSFQTSSSRLTSHYSTDNDYEIDTGSSSRYSSSKYKISQLSSDDDDLGTLAGTRKYSRYSIRDENDNIGTSSTTTTRLSRYSSSYDGDDLGGDLGGISSSSVVRRRTSTRLSYLNEDDDDKLTPSSPRSYRPSLTSYEVTTPVDDDYKSFGSSSFTAESSEKRRFGSNSARSLSRTDSKDASNQIYEVILDYKPPRSAIDEISLKEGQEVIVLSKDKPHKWKVRTRKSKNFTIIEEGFAPSAYLKPTNEKLDSSELIQAGMTSFNETTATTNDRPKIDQTKELNKKKEMIVRELIETEEDLIRDMQFVLRTYIRQSDSSITPKEIKSVKDQIFGCFKELLEFHKDVLLKNFQNLAKEPTKIGSMFLKIREDFANHSKYCQNLSKALDILEDNSDVNEYFNNYSVKIKDEKPLSEHLKLPLQRLNDYQLLLKELSKNLSRLDEDVSDLEKAVKFIATVPDNDVEGEEEDNKKQGPTAAAFDLTTTDFNLPGGSTEKLSNLLKNVLQAKDFFEVIESDGSKKERFIFFFKSRMFITEINKNISADQRTYNVEKIIKLPEVEICAEDPKTLLIKSKDKSNPSFPLRLKCDDEQRIKTWLEIINNLSKISDDSEEISEPKSIGDLKQSEENRQTKLDENNNKIQQQQKLSQPIDDTKYREDCQKDNKNPSDTTAPQEVVEDTIQPKKTKPESTSKATNHEKDDDNYIIISELKSITKPIGDSAIFQCQVSPGTVNVQWLKDNGILSGSNYKTYKKDDCYFLELRDLSVEHSGIYTFIASNAKKSVATSSSLNVLSDDSRPTSPGGSFLPHPPKFKVKLKNTELLEGATVRFELIVRGLPIPTISIFKDGKPLKEDDHLKVKFQSKEVFEIIIEKVDQNDAGIYKCVAVNPEGEAETLGKITVSKNKDVFFGLDDNAAHMMEKDITSPRCTSPSFKWFKDGKEFEASERFQVQYDDQEDTVALIFQHVTPNDAGLYTCVAATSSGKISCNAELNVLGVVTELPKTPMAPKFLKELSNVQVIKGQSVAMLEAQISGCPKPMITWYKDDKKLEANDHFKMLTEGEENVTLVIKNVTEEDAGKYKLKASNKLGVVECDAELKIVKMPELTKSQEKIEVTANDQLIIEQTYEAVPEPKIEWLKDGKVLKESKRIKTVIEPQKHRIQLIVDKATSEDAGHYVCMISNDIGSAKKNTEVIVKSVPKFLKRIEACEVIECETATFTGQYSTGGNAKLEIYKESLLLKVDERIQIEEDKDGKFSLIIKDCNADDQGKYRFVIKNDYGLEEDEASLVVKKPSAAPEFKNPLKNLEAMLNDENVQLSVKIEGEPKPEVKWFHDGKPITANDDKFKIIDKHDGSTLVIPKVLLEHQGTYLCKSENPNGSAETTAALVVKCPPYVVKHLDNIQSDLGTDVQLTAIIKGNPKPDVKWFCNDQEIKIDDRKKYGYDEASAQYTLSIKKLQEEDLGVYKIKAQNAYGECVSSSDVQIVSGKPYVVKELENLEADFGMDVELTAIIKGNPKPDIKWFCNDQEIKIGDRKKYCYDEASAQYKLFIKKLQQEDLGVYKIEAQNTYGKCASSSNVQLASKPLFSKVLKNIAVKEMESNIEMVVQLDKKNKEPLVKWYKDDEEIGDKNKNYKKIADKLDNSYKLVILKATEETVGKYKCVASNDFGSAETAARFDIITKPSFIQGLSDVDVMEGNNVSMTVKLAGFPQPDVSFYKNGEEISAEAKVQIKKVMDDIYEFQIENIRIIMSGEYECRIKNEAGEASSKGVIQVCSKPKFLKDLPEQMNVDIGEDVVLEVLVDGSPSPQVKWFVNGKETAGSERLLLDQRAESYSLKIPQAKESDSGQYHCVASNKIGEMKSKTTNIQVSKSESAPQFTKRLEDVEVVVDDNVQMRTAVKAVPPADVFWSKDSVPLQSGPKIQIKTEGDEHVLIMKNVQQSDSGLITCKAQNATGFTTQTAFLSVEEPTLPTISGLNDLKVIDGEPCRIEAIVKGFPKPIVQWFKNDDQPLDSEYTFCDPKNNKYGIDIACMSTNMAGPYKCVASNGAGAVEKGFSVDICGKKPTFLKELEETEIVMSMDRRNNRLQLGQSAIFETIVDSVPISEVKWYKNDKELRPSDRIIISTVENENYSATEPLHNRLEIKSLTKDDVAKYSCIANNKYGQAQTVCLLKFLNEPHEPIIKKPLEDCQIEQGDELKLFCKVDGEPMPAVRWLKDQEPLEGNERAQITSRKDGSTTLVIEKTELADSGIYQVDAENAKGVASSTAKILVVEPKRPPTFPVPLKENIKVDNNKCLVLEAEVFGLPPPTIEWLKDGKPLKPDARIQMTNDNGKCRLQIDKAQTDDAGCYSLKAINDSAQMVTSSTVQVMPEFYAPLVVESLPVTVQVSEDGSIEIHSKIQAYPPAKITWQKDKQSLSPNDRIQIKNDDDGKTCLTIQSAKPEDQGTYILKAENPVGETSTSTKVQIISSDQAKPIEEPMLAKDKKKSLLGDQPQPSDEELNIEKSLPNEIQIGSEENLALQMKLSNKPATITIDDVKIYKNDQILPKEKNLVQINDDGEIKFQQENCSPKDSGLYRIEVQTPNRSLSSSCLVKVFEKEKQPEKKLRFKRELEPVEVDTSGSPCRFECVIDADVNDLMIKWFKDGEELMPNEHYGFVKEPNGTIALLIDSFAAKDIGMYTVKISDKQEELISTGKASLKSALAGLKPHILEELKDVSGDDKTALCLKCQVSPDSGPITCKWLCNGKELAESDAIKFLNFPDGTTMLQMNGVGPNDSGKYSVVISNKAGETTSEVDVKIKPKEDKKPTILKGLQPITLIAGQPGSMELQLDTSDGDIKFLLGSKHLIPDDRIHIQQLPDGIIKLNFDEVTLDDAGTYTAIFKNNGGSAESSALVTVKSQPIVVKPLEDMAVKEKCSTRFEVQIEANPEPEVVWTKGGSKIKLDGNHFTTAKINANTYCLIINDCVIRDKGEYAVKATNDLGTATSKAKLDIVSGKEFEECSPIFLENLRDLTAGKNETVMMQAKIKAHPVPKIVWKKDNQEIQMNPDKIFSSFNGEDLLLTILNFGQDDMGVYEVYVSNDLGQTSSSAKLAEKEGCKPVFVKKLQDLETDFKSPTKLKCKVEAYPEATIKWLYNGKPIESCSKYSFTQEYGEQVLSIFDPTEMDSGMYECLAENNLGSDKTSSNVLFIEKSKEPVQFIEKLQDYDVLPGSTARLTACVIGNPKPEFKWFKDEKEIKIDNDKYVFTYNENGMITFEIRNVNENDLGKYRCHAFNPFGGDNSIGQLNFETVAGLDRMNQLHKSKKSQQRAMDADDVNFQTGGLPQKLNEKPIITKMIDDSLTLFWIPSIPEQPRFPVSYVVEFCKISDGVWSVYHDGIKDSKCDLVGLEPYEDYGFRVRVENKFGISDPSPQVTAFRSQLKDQEVHLKPAKPDDFGVEHKLKEKIAAAPEFLRDEASFMYGTVGLPVTIEFWIYGYPEPEVTWFFEEKKLENQGRFKYLKDRNGRTCLFIDKMTDQDIGYFTCVAKNEHGEQKKTIKLLRADPPKFKKILEETNVLERNHIRLQCSFIGSPEPTVKWFKDYQPLHDTSRIKVVRDSAETTTLTISDAILRDSGLYSCTVTNIAGSSTTSAFVHVKDQEVSFDRYPSSYRETIKPKNKKMEQIYDIGDELGRGTQGIVYHAVERTTGQSYAAKMMHGVGEMRQYMIQELEIMNQLGSHQHLAQLHDCLASTPYSMSLIMGLCGGGTLMDHILKKGSITEQEVAIYIRQILEGLNYMHYKNIGHFGLTIGDILLQRINGSDLTIVDFGLAQRVAPGASHYVEFGQPEFVSPEIVNKNSVTLTTDIWSVGIITHILVTGISPFFGENDKTTLQNIQSKNLDLSEEKLGQISDKGRDFLRKTLNFDPNHRFDVNAALNHPWITNASNMEAKNKLDIMENLRKYKFESDKWYRNASCKRYYRRRTLHSCYTHPSKMIYPPDEQYSPLISPERELKKFNRTVAPFENIYPRNQTFGSEAFSSESHYQCGPDTYLLQLRDTDFPTRIRRYLRMAAVNSPTMASNLQQSHWGRSNWEHAKGALTGTFSQVAIKERRKFTDVMDEEINDEMKGHFYGKPRRLAREVGTPLYYHGQLKTLKKETKVLKEELLDESDCLSPFFREKLKDQSYKSGDIVALTCYAVGIPSPTYTWFRNDTIVIETNRTKVKRTDDGRCQLILEPSKDYDIGVYKCVARNTLGSVVCRARLVLGDVPSNLIPPTIKDYSARSTLLMWCTPKYSGDAYIQCYRLEFKKIENSQWMVVNSNDGQEIKQEFYLVNDLEPNQSYHFRLSAQNKFGWSETSAPSETVKMLPETETKTIALPQSLQFVVCADIDQTTTEVPANTDSDYQIEKVPVPLIKSEYKELYDFKSIIAVGKFSVITRAYIKDGTRKTLACKCVLSQSENESAINNEYEICKSLAHVKIARLMYANRDPNLFTLTTEMFCGLNILTYLGRMQSYTEQLVATILCQVLDAIEYLHFRNIALLELQPDNVLMVDERSLQIKLTDFANSRFITDAGSKVTIIANPEYIAPELIRNDEVSLPYTDIWTVGVLAYILLSGHSPFKGNDSKETAQNVVFVRYLFERLYPKVTQEAIRFLLSVFKLTSHKRPTIEECFESKWLLPNEFMIKKREAAIFDTEQINNFAKEFFEEKSSQHSRLFDLIGLKL